MNNKYNYLVKKTWIPSMLVAVLVGIFLILKFNNWIEAIVIGIIIYYIENSLLKKLLNYLKMKKEN